MVTTWDNIEKTGTIQGGWTYDEVDLSYDSIQDTQTGNSVYYNGLGVNVTWTNQTPKVTTTYTNVTKTSSTWTNQNKV